MPLLIQERKHDHASVGAGYRTKEQSPRSENGGGGRLELGRGWAYERLVRSFSPAKAKSAPSVAWMDRRALE